jgi:small subunit ribosomal protein S19e
MSVSKQELIKALAEKLRPMLRKPLWAEFVRTGMHKERPPTDADWWFMRGASILLKVQKLQPIGVSKLRRHYGGRKNRGVAPEHVYKGSGSIARKLLQQLESVGLLKQETRAGHKGRVLTPKSQSLISQTIKELDKAKPKEKAEAKPEKTEAKQEKAVAKLEKPEAKHEKAEAKQEASKQKLAAPEKLSFSEAKKAEAKQEKAEAKQEANKEATPTTVAKQGPKGVGIKKQEPKAVEVKKEDEKVEEKKDEVKKEEMKKEVSVASGAGEE